MRGPEDLREVARKIRQKILEKVQQRRKLAAALRSLKSYKVNSESFGESMVIEKIPEGAPRENFSVVGVDGGLLKSNLHGIDLVMVRAVAVNFNFRQEKLQSSEYLGDDAPEVFLDVLPEEIPLELYANLFRVRREISMALKAVEYFAPDYLLLDGPVYPHPSLEICKTIPELKGEYKRLLNLYSTLERLCEEHSCILAGVIEDSKSGYFVREITRLLPIKESSWRGIRDTVLLSEVLDPGERTFPFMVPLQSSPFRKKVLASYLRSSGLDRPYRIEVCTDSFEDVAEIARLVAFLSAFKGYSLPSVLIEADLRAKIPKSFKEYFLRLINLPFETALMELRRRERVL